MLSPKKDKRWPEFKFGLSQSHSLRTYVIGKKHDYIFTSKELKKQGELMLRALAGSQSSGIKTLDKATETTPISLERFQSNSQIINPSSV